VGQAATEAVEPPHHERVPGAQVVERGFEPGPVLAGAGHDVLEDPLDAEPLQFVTLLAGQVRQAQSLRAAGESTADIQATLGCARSTLYRALAVAPE
jgi:hypothetical protein